MICVSVAHIGALDEVISSDADLIELRLDLLKEQPSELYKRIPREMKTIVTCRPGVYEKGKRLELLIEGMKLGASFVDIEIETGIEDMEVLLEVARQSTCTVIVSYHNFEKTLDREDLESVMIACYEKGGEISKIATRVNAPEDIRNLLSLYDLPGRKVILGMGNQGRITRVVGPYLGAEFTFASMDEAGTTAPGQLSFKQLNEIYKVIDKS